MIALALLAACTDGPGVSVTTGAPAGGGTDAVDTTLDAGGTATTEAPDGAQTVASSGPITESTTVPPTTPGGLAVLDVTEASDLVATFDTTDLYDFSILSAHRSDPAVVAAARQTLDSGATGPAAWAATYVWVNEGDAAEPLLALVANADPAVQVMAATGLLARGRVEGFAPLVALLVSDASTPGWPPSAVWQDATVALVRYTAIAEHGPPFDASPVQRQDAAARWQAWLDEHRDTLTFDPEVALWTVG